MIPFFWPLLCHHSRIFSKSEIGGSQAGQSTCYASKVCTQHLSILAKLLNIFMMREEVPFSLFITSGRFTSITRFKCIGYWEKNLEPTNAWVDYLFVIGKSSRINKNRDDVVGVRWFKSEYGWACFGCSYREYSLSRWRHNTYTDWGMHPVGCGPLPVSFPFSLVCDRHRSLNE